MGRDQNRERGRMRRTWRQLLCSGAALLAISPLSPAAMAQERTFAFSIDSQPLASALLVFGRQAKLSVLAPADLVAGKTAPAIRGELAVGAALEQLLDGTGLYFQFVQEDAVRITGPDRSKASTDSDAPVGVRRTSFEDDRVIITGTSISGIYPASSPLEVYTSEDLARSGAATTEQFVRNMPQNLGATSQFAPASTGAGANYDGVTAVDLRGLGVGTTLVLVNGRRMSLANLGQSVDVSMIPMGAIERVEVLTDGASAIYGSDAVGGVVNFVLRDDFEGAESRLSVGGVARGGMRQGSASQTFGARWDAGHGLLSYTYHNTSSLKRTDRAYSTPSGPGSLTPAEVRNNLFGTISQKLGDQLQVDAHFSLGQREVKNEVSNLVSVPRTQNFQTYNSSTDQYSGDVTVNYQINPDWRVSAGATYSEIDVDALRSFVYINRVPLPPATRTNFSTNDTMLDVMAKVEGAIFSLPGGDVRFSAGGGFLEQKFKGYSPVSTRQSAGSLGRRSPYAFAEVFAPIVGPSQDVPFVERLELSLALRYTDYEDRSSPAIEREFGDSIDPKIGLFWAPTSTLGLRATYGTSFRAPFVSQIDPSGGEHYLTTSTIAGIPDTPYLGVGGYAERELAPETATTYTAGFDYRPASISGFELAATYYNIDYENRIGIAPQGGLSALATPQLLPDVIFRPPSAAFVEELLNATPLAANTTSIDLSDTAAGAQALFALPNFWIYDTRYKNLAMSKQDGIDLSASYQFETPLGDARLAASVTHILNYTQQGSPAGSVLTATDVPGAPADWRGRLSAGLSNGPFDATLSMNVVDEYANPAAPVGKRDISSWTTFDLNLSWDFGANGGGTGKGPRLNLSAQNLFDEDPPFLETGAGSNIIYPVGFDPANSNPLGRFVVLGVVQRW